MQVDVRNGAITNSPNNIEKSEIEDFFEKAETFLNFSMELCRFLRDYQQSPPDAIRNNLTIFKDNLGNFSLSYDEA